MSRFLVDATEIFEAASVAPFGSSPAMTILIHPQGQIHIVDGDEVPIDSLQARHGCRTAFRVTRGVNGVRVDGRDGSTRCVLHKANPPKQAATLGLFHDRPLYSMMGPLAIQ